MAAIFCGFLLSIVTSNLLPVSAPPEPKSVSEPTLEQLAAGKETYGKIGAKYQNGYSLSTGQITHIFRLPDKITDADLKNLPDPPFGFVLILRECPAVTDSGLKELKQLKNLTGLFLGKTKVTPAGLKELSEFKNLTTVGFSGVNVTDESLKGLKDLKKLTEIILIQTKVTDAGIKNLKDLTNLAYVCLEEANVTDAGIKELQILTNLARLDLRGTKVTAAGLKQFQEALPKCKITK